MCGDELPDDGQAESGTASAARPRGIGTIEAIEDVRQNIGGDAAPAVGDRDDLMKVPRLI
jgi:hypothetical protein